MGCAVLDKELEHIETLEEDTKKKVKKIVEWSELVLGDTKYRLSLPDYFSGYPCFRTAEQQYSLFLKGRPHLEGGKKGGVVTHTDGYDKKSYHQSGKAIDIGIRLRDGKKSFLYYDKCPAEAKAVFDLVVEKFKEEGFEWGGDWNWKDWNHFQRE